MTDANGLYHMRARYYNPDIKRFINRDVVRGMLDAAQTLNRYAYVNGNPISYIDPFGLSRDGDLIWLQGGSFLLDTVPYVGTLKGFQQAFSGVNHVTGGKLSTSERWSEGVGSALSLVPIPGLKHVGKYGTDGAVSLWRKLDLQFFAGRGTGKQTLYHYTSEAGTKGILSSNKLNPSLKEVNPKDARYGNGQYLTDIIPGSKTSGQLSRQFFGIPFLAKRVSHYIEIDIKGLNVVKGRDGVYVILNERPLDLTGRVVKSGQN